MIITAKFASTCPQCTMPIPVGAQVEWERGAKARHAVCPGIHADGAQQTEAPQQPRVIELAKDGRRYYITGDTMAVRGLLRGAGCHWDPERRAWWIGSLDKATEIIERAKTAKAEAAPDPARKRVTACVECGATLDDYQIRRGFKFCSQDCVDERRLGGQSGYINGHWHQGDND